MAERVQKVLAARGLGSRREIETWIERGEVQVNNRTAGLGDQVDPDDVIRVRGRIVRRPARAHRWIVYHKPVGEICSRSDPEGRRPVFASLPRLKGQRWVAVGRLDLNTSGLLLFTTDGELANRLMHPGKALEREYAVRVLGEVPQATRDMLLEGVELEDGPARFDALEAHGGEGANQWFHGVVTEGRNRLVRRLWDAVGISCESPDPGPVRPRGAGPWPEVRRCKGSGDPRGGRIIRSRGPAVAGGGAPAWRCGLESRQIGRSPGRVGRGAAITQSSQGSGGGLEFVSAEKVRQVRGDGAWRRPGLERVGAAARPPGLAASRADARSLSGLVDRRERGGRASAFFRSLEAHSGDYGTRESGKRGRSPTRAADQTQVRQAPSPNLSRIGTDLACLLVPQGIFPQSAVITDTPLLRKLPCETNILRDIGTNL